MKQGLDWYKREPRAFLDGVQGMGPELIGAYAVLLDLMYARGGDTMRDDRHLSGILGCSVRKARALTDQLIEAQKIHQSGEIITNKRVEKDAKTRRNERETYANRQRMSAEQRAKNRENNDLSLAYKRREEREKSKPPIPPLNLEPPEDEPNDTSAASAPDCDTTPKDAGGDNRNGLGSERSGEAGNDETHSGDAAEASSATAKPKRRRPAKPVTADFWPTPAGQDYFRAKHGVSLPDAVEHFIGIEPNRKRATRDCDAAWRTFCSRGVEYGTPGFAKSGSRGGGARSSESDASLAAMFTAAAKVGSGWNEESDIPGIGGRPN